MAKDVLIGERAIGKGYPTFVIAEIGINHNGDLDIARRLVDVAVRAGCDAVKFQKRTVEVVYTKEELAAPRESVYGNTNGDLKRGLELGKTGYDNLDQHCRKSDIILMASCWDEASVDFIERYDPPAYKIASASLTDDDLLRYHRTTGKPLILSTGMSTLAQIDHAVDVLGTDDLVLMHCTSAYPCPNNQLNLGMIATLADRYDVPVGYSGHESGLATTVAAAALGASVIERHITLDRAMWGSDQAASVEPQGMSRLVRDIRTIEQALGDGVKQVYDNELPIIDKLRRVDTMQDAGTPLGRQAVVGKR